LRKSSLHKAKNQVNSVEMRSILNELNKKNFSETFKKFFIDTLFLA